MFELGFERCRRDRKAVLAEADVEVREVHRRPKIRGREIPHRRDAGRLDPQLPARVILAQQRLHGRRKLLGGALRQVHEKLRRRQLHHDPIQIHTTDDRGGHRVATRQLQIEPVPDMAALFDPLLHLERRRHASDAHRRLVRRRLVHEPEVVQRHLSDPQRIAEARLALVVLRRTLLVALKIKPGLDERNQPAEPRLAGLRIARLDQSQASTLDPYSLDPHRLAPPRDLGQRHRQRPRLHHAVALGRGQREVKEPQRPGRFVLKPVEADLGHNRRFDQRDHTARRPVHRIPARGRVPQHEKRDARGERRQKNDPEQHARGCAAASKKTCIHARRLPRSTSRFSRER